jgi:signal transduction histidine kinase
LDETIQEILEYSRNARLELKLEHFDVAELTQIICEDLRFTASNEIDFNISNTGSTFLVTDKSRLNTVLKNIISNSVKYKKVNSKDCYINISLSSIGNSMIITITDNGIGIHPNSIPKIFEMFYRGTSTSVGTGLGLYIAKEILSKLKASINVSSEIGIGTTMTINIPNLTNISDDKIFIN